MIDRFFNRTDAYARYNPSRKQWECVKEPMTEEVAALHLSGEIVIGAYSTDPANQSCKWCCWDLDAHGSGIDDKSKLLEVTTKLARVMVEKFGVYSVIEDSGGGYHVWAFFDEPVPAADLIDWKGEIEGIEFFPKQRQIPEGGYGNLVRVPGRHHKKTDHWSRVLIDGQWLDWDDAKEVLFDPPINEAALIPVAPEPVVAPASTQSVPSYVRTGADAEIVPEDPIEAARFTEALKAVQGHNDDRDTWLRVGMILHHERGNAGFADWATWSSTSSKFDPGDQWKNWESFGKSNGAKPLTRATLFRMAKAGSGKDEPVTGGVDDVCEFVNALWNVTMTGLKSYGSEATMTRYVAVFDVGGVPVDVHLGGAAGLQSQASWTNAYIDTTRRKLRVAGNGAKDKAKNWEKITDQVISNEFIEFIDTGESISQILYDHVEAYFSSDGQVRSYESIADGSPVEDGDFIYINKRHFDGWMRASGGRLPDTVKTTLQWFRASGARSKSISAVNDDGDQKQGRYWEFDKSWLPEA